MEVIIRILPIDPIFQVDKIKLDQVIELVFKTVREQYHKRFQNKQSPFTYREEELISSQIDQEIKEGILTEVRD